MALIKTAKSAQLIKRESVGWAPLKATEQSGRVRCDYFEFNTTDELEGHTLAEGDSIPLLLLRKGTRILKGRCMFEAMGIDQTADLGLFAADDSGHLDVALLVDDDPNFFTTAAIAVAAIGEADFGVLQEDNPGYILEKDCYLTVTLDDTSSADPWAADKDFSGYVLYVTD